LKDIASLDNKYLRAIEWIIPEVDETKARQMILDELRQAISRSQSQPETRQHSL
jgi:DNA polymerase sigma